MSRKTLRFGIALAVAAMAGPTTSGADTAGTRPTARPGQADAAAGDYQRMLDVLHITVPAARSPNARSPWDAGNNYDEAKANPFPLSDPLLLKDGRRVTDAATWWDHRRPEILHAFQADVYGRIPDDAPAVKWEVTGTNPAAYGGTVAIRSVTGHIDNSAYPAATPTIRLMTYLPARAAGPVPVMVVIGGGGGRAGRTATSRPDPLDPQGPPAGVLRQLLDLGWGYATYEATAVQPDSAVGLRSGIIGLVSRGRPRRPDDWGALAAWSWGLSRSMDYLATDPAVDAKRLGVEGHSRWGKTAMVAAAYDRRWAICFASCSGEGGAKPSRRNWGETVDDLAGIGEYYWMAGNFLKYGGRWDDLPVDSPELIALIAPRPLFITGGTTDRWADPRGEFMAVAAASPVYELLGKDGPGSTRMPPPDVGLISGDLAFRYHTGGHTDSLDWPTFLTFAQRQLKPSVPGAGTKPAP